MRVLGYHITAMQLASLNSATQNEFTAILGTLFEHSPWVAARAWEKRAFADWQSLHGAMMAAVREASDAEKLALIRAHPELAGREAAQGTLTAESSSEQARLGFSALSREEFLRMQSLNRSYREKFGFPCIVALVLHATRESVMNEMQASLERTAAEEIERAMAQIGEITRGRLEKMAKGD